MFELRRRKSTELNIGGFEKHERKKRERKRLLLFNVEVLSRVFEYEPLLQQHMARVFEG